MKDEVVFCDVAEDSFLELWLFHGDFILVVKPGKESDDVIFLVLLLVTQKLGHHLLIKLLFFHHILSDLDLDLVEHRDVLDLVGLADAVLIE